MNRPGAIISSSRLVRVILLLPAVLLMSGLIGCVNYSGVYGSTSPDGAYSKLTNAPPPSTFSQEQIRRQQYAGTNEISRFSESAGSTYKLGSGDRFEFLVRGRPDISVKEIIVSPDGQVALPRVGILDVNNVPLSELTATITEKLRQFYEEPEVTLVMKEYNNNKVYVLGRVANPGVVHFHGQGNLLEALSLAGGLPVDTTRSWLSRCMIVRGNDVIIWVDLRDLLDNGNMALNARLRNGDVIYIPQSLDQVAYVMGEVMAPGLLHLRSTMTLLDAIMTCGGPTEDAIESKVYLIRAAGTDRGGSGRNQSETYVFSCRFTKKLCAAGW